MADEQIRKRSPRAPSIPLSEAIDRAIKVYDAEGKHPAPYDVVAKHIGYTNPSSGAAATTLASLRYYGLLERPKEGFLAASRDLETYKFAPDDAVRHQLLVKWVSNPPLFADLLTTYTDSLPSDGNLKFDLIKRGFKSTTADECVAAFRDSVTLARYYEKVGLERSEAPATSNAMVSDEKNRLLSKSEYDTPKIGSETSGMDQIPVRLSGGRRAWVIVPTPFYETDKQRLMAQINLLLTDGEQG